ncbi:MAG: putative DNA binding domain-containing protein [Fimbriimonadaceae bacterium]|nr:putative DNA binding domain-containing protein [Fimbriimonadaceae bacterium]
MAKSIAATVEDLARSLRVESGKRNLPPAKLQSTIALDMAVRWAIRIAFLKLIVGAERLVDLYQSSLDPESSHDFPQLLRLVLENGVFEPSQSARSRIEPLVGKLDYWGEPLEPVEWISADLSHDSKRIVFEPTVFRPLLDAKYQLADLLQFCPLLSRIPSLSERFSTAFKTDAMLATYNSALESGISNSLQMVSFEPENEFISLNFPPEGQTREYKATFRFYSKSGQKNSNQQAACLKSIAGFLNAHGGTLIIGISDDLEIIGLKGDFSLISAEAPIDAFVQIVHEAVKTSLKPIPIGLVEVTIRPCGLGSIAVISCRNSGTPIYFNEELYVRDGNRTLRLNEQQAADFLYSKRINSTL